MTDTTAEAITGPAGGHGHGHDDHAHEDHDPIHAENPHLAHHFDTPQQQFDAGKLGIWLFLVTEVLFFSGLFCAYTIYRSQHPEIFIWSHYFLDKTLGAINTGVLILSSLTAAWAVRNAQLAQHGMLKVNIVITIACACAFMGIKYHEYHHKYEVGLLPGHHFNPTEKLWELEDFKEKHPEAAALAEKLYEEEKNPKKAEAAAPAAGTAEAVASAAAPAAPAAATGSAEAAAAPAASGSAGTPAAASGKPAAVAEAKAGAKPAAKKGEAKAAAKKGEAKVAAKPADAAAGAKPAADGKDAPALAEKGTEAAPSPAPAVPATAAPAGTTAAAAAPAASAAPETPQESIEDPNSRLRAKLEPLIEAGVIGPHSMGGVSRPKNAHIFFGLYFFMTGLHGIHVLVGIGIWIWMLVRAFKGQFGPKYFGPVDYTALYWHLVDLIWIYLFPLLYLIH